MDTREFFNERAGVYNQVSRWASNERLNVASDEMLSGLRGRIAVDVGAGTGIMLSRLHGFRKKVALDISAAMLAQIQDSSIEKVVGDVHKMTFPDGYADLVLCRQLLHYCDVDVALRGIKRILHTNGMLHVVQVVDVPGVPEEWDHEWASFRNVSHRMHLRRRVLETAFRKNTFETVKQGDLILRDRYSWSDFFLKHRVGRTREVEVRSFFERTSRDIAEAINLVFDESGISYNRLFGLWLLRSKQVE